MAFRVVSAPALNRSEKNMYSSPSLSWGRSESSTVARATTDSMSSAGRRLFSAISALP